MAGMVMATVPVKTKIPDDAAGREPSALVCWIQKPGLLPIVRTAVTIPGTRSTVAPLSSERKPLPWMSWMDFGPGWQAGSAGLAAQSTGGVTTIGGAFGVGAPTVKSAALLPVLVNAVDRALGRRGVASGRAPGQTPRSRRLTPYPTKSTTPDAESQSPAAQPGVVVLFTSATLPAVAHMAMEPTASGVGSGVVPPAPAASWTR